MFTKDESENLLDHLTERINPNGWRVISKPTRPPDPEADELKALIQTMQQSCPSVTRPAEGYHDFPYLKSILATEPRRVLDRLDATEETAGD